MKSKKWMLQEIKLLNNDKPSVIIFLIHAISWSWLNLEINLDLSLYLLPESLKLPHLARFPLQILNQQVSAPTLHVIEYFLLVLGQHFWCCEVGDAADLLLAVLDVDVQLEGALLVVVVKDAAELCVGVAQELDLGLPLLCLLLSPWKDFLCWFGSDNLRG